MKRRLLALHSDRAADGDRIEAAAADVFLGLNRRTTARAEAQAEFVASIGRAARTPPRIRFRGAQSAIQANRPGERGRSWGAFLT